MLIMVRKVIRGGIFNTIHRYAKAKNKSIKDYDKNQESSYLKYWNVNSLYGWEMPHNLPLNKFEWMEKTSQFNEDFIKNQKKVKKDVFFKVHVQYPEKLHELHNDLPFLPERKKL